MHWVVVSALATSAASAQAQAHDRPSTGPAPVNSTASISAGEGDDVGGDGNGAPSDQAAGPQEHGPGTYAGVTPGGAQAPAVTVAAGQTPATVTWPGFQMRPDGTSRVFFQSTVPVAVQAIPSPGKFVLKLPGTQVAGDNNRLALETRFFNTPVTRVNITHARDGVTVTLELRAAVTPQVSAERGASGYFFTYIDLPAGSYLTEAEKQVVATPAHDAAQPAAAAKAGKHTDHSDMPGYLDEQPGASAGAAASGKTSAKASGSAHVDTSMDRELPPGMKPTGKARASTKAEAGIKLGN
jgi:hypothetical protein